MKPQRDGTMHAGYFGEQHVTTGQLFEVMRRIADACFDGHLTIMKFTTNWRVQFGDHYPVAHASPEEAWAAIHAMPMGTTLRDAFLTALVQADWPHRPRPLMPDALLPREPPIP